MGMENRGTRHRAPTAFLKISPLPQIEKYSIITIKIQISVYFFLEEIMIIL
jgi:hypothetical protein